MDEMLSGFYARFLEAIQAANDPPPDRVKFDIVFADPPYALHDLPQLPRIVFESDVLTDDGIFILEHPKEFSFEDHPNFWQHRAYGKVNFTFFAKNIDN